MAGLAHFMGLPHLRERQHRLDNSLDPPVINQPGDLGELIGIGLDEHKDAVPVCLGLRWWRYN